MLLESLDMLYIENSSLYDFVDEDYFPRGDIGIWEIL